MREPTVDEAQPARQRGRRAWSTWLMVAVVVIAGAVVFYVKVHPFDEPTGPFKCSENALPACR